ncbi:MAG: MaoC/PaaZ C-terminal domain-containing protein [Gemmatimonadales bacterium]
MGLYYEDLEIGREFRTAAREVTEADVRAFADLTGDRNPLHLDRAYAATTAFGEPVAHGVLGLALAAGLASQLEITKDTLVALVGLSWRFRGPVHYGESIAARLKVTARRLTGKQGQGLVTFAVEVVNAGGDVVQEGELVELVLRKP